MKFSIITPVWNRWGEKMMRCLWSVQRQQFRWGTEFPNFEHIVIDDGSTDKILKGSYGDLQHVRHHRIEHSGRVIARNVGMEEAEGDWICWLDSDDALDPMYLATFDYYIKKFPKVKLWLCGAVVHGILREDGEHKVPIYTKLRHAWKPPLKKKGRKVIHDDFPSGKIGTGMFMFHRSLLKKAWPMPEWKTHYELADGIDEYLGYETGYSAAERWVGNPWGDDHAFFRKLTMNTEAHLVGEDNCPCLYIHYVR